LSFFNRQTTKNTKYTKNATPVEIIKLSSAPTVFEKYRCKITAKMTVKKKTKNSNHDKLAARFEYVHFKRSLPQHHINTKHYITHKKRANNLSYWLWGNGCDKNS